MDSHATRAIDAAPTNSEAVPAPPTERELAILERVLRTAHVDDVATLRSQLRMLQVAPSSDATCRIYLLHPDAPRSSFAREGRSKLPHRYPVYTPKRRLLGEVNVWVEDGHLRALQYVTPEGQGGFGLPRPDWIEVPAAPITADVRVAGAMQSMSGAWALGTDPVRAVTTEVETTAPSRRPIAFVLLTLAALALAIVAFMGGQGSGADLDAARAAGTDAGAVAGTADGDTLGTFDGDTQGRIAGRASTYEPALTAAKARALAAARRAAKQRSDAAAATFAATYGFTCPGSVDANGNWICA